MEHCKCCRYYELQGRRSGNCQRLNIGDNLRMSVICQSL